MKSCKRGVQCSFYILGADKQDYEYRTSLTHIFRQIGLSLLNLNSQPSLKYFTHRKTKRQKEKIQKYENTKRQYTEPPSPTNSTRLPSQSWIWINPSLKCSPPTTKELESFLSSVMQTYWLTKNILQAEFFSQDQKVLLAFWHKPQKLTLHWHKW